MTDDPTYVLCRDCDRAKCGGYERGYAQARREIAEMLSRRGQQALAGLIEELLDTEEHTTFTGTDGRVHTLLYGEVHEVVSCQGCADHSRSRP